LHKRCHSEFLLAIKVLRALASFGIEVVRIGLVVAYISFLTSSGATLFS